MKIEYEIAGGYKRGELAGYIATYPALSQSEATQNWIDIKFVPWINEAITEDFSIYEYGLDFFRLDFPNREHGLTFLTQMGGRLLEK